MLVSKQPRVLVIGLSEATMDLIIPWADAGLLPTFKSLMSEGVSGRLRSQVPLITPQILGTIFTGKSPGYHGLFDFWQREPDGRFWEINGSYLKEKPIWQILSENGVRCGIVNVPFTYPPQKINGFMISGEDAPGAHRSISWPSSLYDEIVRKFGRYRLKDIFPGGRQKTDYLTLIEEDIIKQTDVLEYLVSEKEWDFFLMFYSATAITQHYFWSDIESKDEGSPFRNVIKTAYRCLDNAIARLMRAAGPETIVFVISECGAGPLQSGVQINTWLEKEGFLSRKAKSSNTSNINSSTDKIKSGLPKVVASTRKIVQRHLPQSIYFWVNSHMKDVKAWVQSYLIYSNIDWSRTQAFSRGKEGNIFINLKGRDPHGIVSPGEEYESVRGSIIERLNKLIDPGTGQRAVDLVYRAEELYKGPMLDWAPDLIIEWRDTAYVPTEVEQDEESIFVVRWRENMNWPTSGSHRIEGILFAKGPGISKAKKIEVARIIDLMPTWLYAMNQKIPSHLDGRVISGLFGYK
ncbi:MAG: alkaline phosphatase family protein [Thermodesulfobacteriota bacterium]